MLHKGYRLISTHFLTLFTVFLRYVQVREYKLSGRMSSATTLKRWKSLSYSRNHKSVGKFYLRHTSNGKASESLILHLTGWENVMYYPLKQNIDCQHLTCALSLIGLHVWTDWFCWSFCIIGFSDNGQETLFIGPQQKSAVRWQASCNTYILDFDMLAWCTASANITDVSNPSCPQSSISQELVWVLYAMCCTDTSQWHWPGP